MDNSLLSTLAHNSPKRETPKKKPKLDETAEEEDLFAEDSDENANLGGFLNNTSADDEDDTAEGKVEAALATACVDAEDEAALERFEMELDEHCDFTLMQFVQSSQVEVSKPPLASQFRLRPERSHRELLDSEDFPDIAAGFSQPMSISQFVPQGKFYGLPEGVEKLIQEHKGIRKLYDWQDECLSLQAVKDRKNLIYALPTSSGKTLVAEILIFRELVCQRRDVLFILPFVSIVKEKIAGLAPFAVDLDFYLEEYAAGQGVCPPRPFRRKKSVYIATIEKSLALVDSLIEAGRLHEIGLVVVDELHLLGEAGRGAILETVLTKVKYTQTDTQIIGMSATIGNLHEIEAFLNATVYRQEFRPVELKEFVKCGTEIMAVQKGGLGGTDFVPVRSETFGYDEEMLKVDPDHLGGLVMEVAPKHALLIFCPTKKNCQEVAINLTRVIRQ